MKLLRLIISILLFGFPGHVWSYSANPLELTATESHYQFPFFETQTPVWTYNEQIPGPEIRVKEGSTLVVEFHNLLKEPTSIHWHGLRIDNAMDGVPGVTQDPVEPGHKFTYRLKLEEAGTFWYHPHFNASEQLERGLKGVLIVEESQKLLWSQDMIWLMDDWLLQQDGNIFPQFNTGRDLMHDGRWGNASTVNGKFKPEFHVSPAERIRIRLINGANARVFALDIKGLAAKVIAVDGRPVSQIFSFNHLALSPGNRVDLDITIPTDAGGKTYTVENIYTRKPYPIAFIKVKDTKPVTTPKFEPPTAENFIPAQMFANVKVSKTWDLNAVRGGRFGIGWAMNRSLWPDSDTADFQMGIPQKVVFKNSSSRLHPMHIHGVFFRVLERDGKPAAEPFTRDTVLLGPRETVVVGFVPTHPGIWLTHCHIQEHAEAGMMTTIDVKK